VPEALSSRGSTRYPMENRLELLGRGGEARGDEGTAAVRVHGTAGRPLTWLCRVVPTSNCATSGMTSLSSPSRTSSSSVVQCAEYEEAGRSVFVGPRGLQHVVDRGRPTEGGVRRRAETTNGRQRRAPGPEQLPEPTGRMVPQPSPAAAGEGCSTRAARRRAGSRPSSTSALTRSVACGRASGDGDGAGGTRPLLHGLARVHGAGDRW